VAGCQKKHTLIELAAFKENKLHNYTLTKLKKNKAKQSNEAYTQLNHDLTKVIKIKKKAWIRFPIRLP